jgi:hypothetical protein
MSIVQVPIFGFVSYPFEICNYFLQASEYNGHGVLYRTGSLCWMKFLPIQYIFIITLP